MSFYADNENFLSTVYSVTEPGAAVRFLNKLSQECESKKELEECIKKVNERLVQLDERIKNDGKDLYCFYDLTKQCLLKIPFFIDEVILEYESNANFDKSDCLHIIQAKEVQKWYDVIMPINKPKQIELPEGFLLRLAGDTDVPQLRFLVNQAYAELGTMGMRFFGVTQNEEQTRERMEGKEIWLVENVYSNELLATIALNIEDETVGKALYISQFGVQPEHKKNGLGSFLLHHSFRRAKEQGIDIIKLDTAVPAYHLVRLYRRFNFEIIDTFHWPRANYPSFLMCAPVS